MKFSQHRRKCHPPYRARVLFVSLILQQAAGCLQIQPSQAVESALYKRCERELAAAARAGNESAVKTAGVKLLTEAANLPPTDKRRLEAFERFAHTYESMGNLYMAEQILREAYDQKIKLNQIQPSQSDLVDLQLRFARVCALRGRVNDSLQISQEALQTQMRRLNEDDPVMLPTLSLLFDAYLKDRRYDKAVTAGQRILTTIEKKKPVSQASLSFHSARLAYALALDSQAKQSEKLLSAVKLPQSGSNKLSAKDRDLYTLTALTVGATNCQHANYSQAERWYRRALSLQAEKDSLLSAVCYQALAQMELKKRNLSAAEQHYLQSLRIVEGTSALDRVIVLGALARIYIARGTIGGAINYCQQAIVAGEKSTGLDSVETMSALSDLNDLGIKYSCVAKTDSIFQKLDQAAKRRVGPAGKSTGMAIILLGSHNRRMGRIKIAASQIEEGLNYIVQSGDKFNPEYAQGLKELSSCYILEKNPGKAAAALKESIALETKLISFLGHKTDAGVARLDDAFKLLVLAEQQMKQGNKARAAESMQQAQAIIARVTLPLPLENCTIDSDGLNLSMLHAELALEEKFGY